MMMLAALLVCWAARVVPSALGLATATVNFGGNLQVGPPRPYVVCTPPTITPITRGGAPRTVQMTCINNMDVQITVSVTKQGALTPTATRPPTVTVTGSSVTIAPGGSGSANITITTANNTTRNPYTQGFSTSVTGSNGLDYSKSHSVSFTIQ
ncbi:MAG: hypothetical protein JWN15_321 [Firmicutes bacterium]|nr:hypothetical protein [Bacillota bacterium]